MKFLGFHPQNLNELKLPNSWARALICSGNTLLTYVASKSSRSLPVVMLRILLTFILIMPTQFANLYPNEGSYEEEPIEDAEEEVPERVNENLLNANEREREREHEVDESTLSAAQFLLSCSNLGANTSSRPSQSKASRAPQVLDANLLLPFDEKDKEMDRDTMSPQHKHTHAHCRKTERKTTQSNLSNLVHSIPLDELESNVEKKGIISVVEGSSEVGKRLLSERLEREQKKKPRSSDESVSLSTESSIQSVVSGRVDSSGAMRNQAVPSPQLPNVFDILSLHPDILSMNTISRIRSHTDPFLNNAINHYTQSSTTHDLPVGSSLASSAPFHDPGRSRRRTASRR